MPQTNIRKKHKKSSSCKELKDTPTTVSFKNSEEVYTFNSLSQKRESYNFINKGQPNSSLANLDFSFSFSSFPEMDDYSFLCESQLDILYPAESSSAAMAAHIPKEGRLHDERIQDSLLADEVQMRDKKWKGKEPANVDGFFSTELFLKSSLWKESLFYLQKKQLLIKNKIKAQTRERVKRLRDNQKKIKKSLKSSIESTNLSQRFQFFSPRPLNIRIPNPNKTLNQKPYIEFPKDGNHEKRLIIRIPNPNRKVSTNTETSDDIYSETEEIDIGSMEKECPFCRALLYNSETSALCCGNGKVVLPDISNPPEIIKELFTANHSRAKYF